MDQENKADEENQIKQDDIEKTANTTSVADGSTNASVVDDDAPFDPNIPDDDLKVVCNIITKKPLSQCYVGLCLCLISAALFITSLVYPEWASMSYQNEAGDELHRETFGLWTSCVMSVDESIPIDECQRSGVTETGLWIAFQVGFTLSSILVVYLTLAMMKLIRKIVSYRKYSRTEQLKSTYKSITSFHMLSFLLYIFWFVFGMVWSFGDTEDEIHEFHPCHTRVAWGLKLKGCEIYLREIGFWLDFAAGIVSLFLPNTTEALKNALKKELIRRMGEEKFKQFENDSVKSLKSLKPTK